MESNYFCGILLLKDEFLFLYQIFPDEQFWEKFDRFTIILIFFSLYYSCNLHNNLFVQCTVQQMTKHVKTCMLTLQNFCIFYLVFILFYSIPLPTLHV